MKDSQSDPLFGLWVIHGQVLAQWDPPSTLNGELEYYELWIRGQFSDEFLAADRPTEKPSTKNTTTSKDEQDDSSIIDLLDAEGHVDLANHNGVRLHDRGAYIFSGDAGLKITSHDGRIGTEFSI